MITNFLHQTYAPECTYVDVPSGETFTDKAPIANQYTDRFSAVKYKRRITYWAIDEVNKVYNIRFDGIILYPLANN